MEVKSLKPDDKQSLDETKEYFGNLDREGKRANATISSRKLKEIVLDKRDHDKSLGEILSLLDN